MEINTGILLQSLEVMKVATFISMTFREMLQYHADKVEHCRHFCHILVNSGLNMKTNVVWSETCIINVAPTDV